ncbi:MAG: peptide-methionine (S)-S-oxide reductase [Crocinitomix sp.]|jgi:peptide-methionine (S)-S-oxide reductase
MECAIDKIGFGGGCHWCTEGVFNSLIGIEKVEQGWIKGRHADSYYSEAVIVYFNPNRISLIDLIEIHLHTHACTSAHSMRSKYRSAIYTFSIIQERSSNEIVKDFQCDFSAEIITEVLEFENFKLNREDLLDYFYTRPDAPFCQNYIYPKLKLLGEKFTDKVSLSRIEKIEIRKSK